MWRLFLMSLLVVGVLSQRQDCIFEGWTEYPGTCTDAVKECTTCTTKQTCASQCQTDSNCFGYEWVTTNSFGPGRCGHLRVDPQAQNPSGCTSSVYNQGVKYAQKKCRGDTPLRNPSSRSTVNRDRGCKNECPDFPDIPNAGHNGNTTEHGQEVTYFCLYGTTLKPGSPRTISCLGPRGKDNEMYWQTPLPECINPEEFFIGDAIKT